MLAMNRNQRRAAKSKTRRSIIRLGDHSIQFGDYTITVSRGVRALDLFSDEFMKEIAQQALDRRIEDGDPPDKPCWIVTLLAYRNYQAWAVIAVMPQTKGIFIGFPPEFPSPWDAVFDQKVRELRAAPSETVH
jgi:hypothetical protein